MVRSLFSVLIVSVLAWLSSCASVKAPEGGPKDSTAPKLVIAIPINGSTQFSGKSLSLEFTEDVTENNPKQYFLSPITPVTVFEGSRKLKITPDSGFLPNTTYSLRLQKKIKDVREGNYLKDTSIIFSTGDNIDTLSISSTLTTISNEAIRKPVLLLLNAEAEKKYFGLSDSSGLNIIQNFPKGKYYLQAFADGNENYKYDEEEKNLYFDTVIIDSNQKYSFKPLPHKSTPVKIFKQRRADTVSIEGQELINIKGELLKNLIFKNSAKMVYRFLSVSKIELIEVSDSLGNCIVDTISPAEMDSSRSITTMPLEKSMDVTKAGKLHTITFSYTWKIDISPRLVEINYDSLWKPVPFKTLPFALQVELPEAKAGEIKLRLDTIAFFNKTGYRLDSIALNKSDFEEVGAVSGEVQSNQRQSIVIEILDDTKKQVAVSTSKSFLFHVKPGKYSMQIFVDWNGDGLYTGGNKKLGRKAEPLFIYPKTIELKPGWDIENLKIDPGFD